MTAHDWALALLLSDDIDDKLRAPPAAGGDAEGLVDRAVALPDQPGRPAAWAFSAERQPFPRLSALDDDRVRGTMLHFFANHELLAIELFALALLRFPSAPAGWRRGLVRIITEEQRHFGMYVDRMQALGVSPGDVPVNRFFWDAAHDLSDPIDLSVRMGLVFEQANLDYCVHYAAALRQVGDDATAAIVDQVLADELGHVAHGLRWFRRWKDPAQSDWDAFSGRLSLPLSPSRAKGPVVQRDLRQRLGFDAEFVDRLDLYGRSKGRPPDVWWWNPTCEADRVGALRLTPAVRALRDDLQALPWVLAVPEDVVLVDRPPGLAWQRQLRDAGFALPELAATVGDRAVGMLQPWGWSPAAEERLGPLRRRQVATARRPVPSDAAFRKDVAAGWLAQWRPELAVLAGRPCGSWDEVEAHAGALSSAGWRPAVKPVLSTAGQGILRRVEKRSVGRLLELQPKVLVVPWLDRRCDLSLHFDVRGDKAHVIGLTVFEADAAGTWRRSLVSRPDSGLPRELLRFLHGQHPRGILGLGRDLARFLAPRLSALGVQGPVGVDMLVGADPAGDLRLQPLVEVNPRWTMGRVALALRPRVAPGVPAWLSLLRRPDGRGGVELDERGRIRSGRLWLTDPEGASIGAVLDVG